MERVRSDSTLPERYRYYRLSPEEGGRVLARLGGIRGTGTLKSHVEPTSPC